MRSRGMGWSVVVGSGTSRTSMMWPICLFSSITGQPGRSLRIMAAAGDLGDDAISDPAFSPGGVEVVGAGRQLDHHCDLVDVAPADPVQPMWGWASAEDAGGQAESGDQGDDFGAGSSRGRTPSVLGSVNLMSSTAAT